MVFFIVRPFRSGKTSLVESLPVHCVTGVSFSPTGTEVIEFVSRTLPDLQQVPGPDIAFCVAAYGNGMTEDRIERTLEDDYLSRDSSPSKRAAYIRRTMEKARRWAER